MFYIFHLYLVEIDKRKIKFDFIFRLICLFDGVWRHFQQYFCCIVSVSFIGGGNRRTRRKPPTCRKALTNFITSFCRPRLDRDSNSTSVVIGTDCKGSCKYQTITATTAPFLFDCCLPRVMSTVSLQKITFLIVFFYHHLVFCSFVWKKY